ncbi:nitroreductase family protein [Vibrio parahaemolyticus]|nr:nitroreductase family protein [Vibrio parahaemolyticus]
MKKHIKPLIPSALLKLYRDIIYCFDLVKCSVYDFMRYSKYTSTHSIDGEEKLLGKLILYYHVLEKGLSFENRKENFGSAVVDDLIKSINEYIDNGYNVNKLQFKTACSVIEKYFAINPKMRKNYSDNIIDKIFSHAESELGGEKVIYKKEILASLNFDYSSFFNSRYSVREFSEEKVETEKLLSALDIAKKYPSVCNRQAVRTYLFTKKDTVIEQLSFQNGNRGFREKIDKLIVVTVDLSLFSKAEERNQPYIDGGIYLMSLLLAIHSKGLGAVALNWSTNKESDKKYRRLGVIKESEVIISFIGVGNLKDKMLVPKSERDSYKETLTQIDE